MRETLHFSHANGFPVTTYRKLFLLLEAQFDVRAIDRFGHDPAYPVTPGWPHLTRQLVHAVERGGTPVWLVGHSLGGFLSLMAALRRPELVRGVVMLVSPIVGGWRALLLRAAQRLGMDERHSPAAATRRRRTHWPDAASVHAHFRSKPGFAGWDEEVLRDYAMLGTEPTGAGPQRTLRFDREIEYRIYRTLPTTLGRQVTGGAPVPVGFIAGTRSRELRQAGIGATRRLVGERLRYVEGGHLYPMERPVETAQAIIEMIASMRDAGRAGGAS